MAGHEQEKENKENKDNKNLYQDSLNLPRTEFSIRANLQQREPEILKRWKEEDLYIKATYENEGSKKFVMHDGPPYANGHIHMGHVLNKVLKDMVCKCKRMSGYHAPFVPGWDCHGLPIEHKVTTEMGIEHKRESVDRLTIKQACREYATKWVNIQREEFKDLGIIADWEHPYITMSPEYQAAILNAFATFVDKGYIERKGKTVPWCASCQTVLAIAEIEHKDRKDPSCFIMFELNKEDAYLTFPFVYETKPDLQVNFLIWTTTPWTIPLNRAVGLNPDAIYVLLESSDPNVAFIVGRGLADKICAELKIEKKVLAEFDALAVKGKKLNHPLVDGLQVPIVFDDMVSLEEGTACLHSAPGCGPEDYQMALRHGLEIFSPLSADGKYLKGIKPDELQGMAVADGQWWVLKKLAETGRLLHKGSIMHSYPHCWRCKNGLIFRATDQWFCDLKKNDLVKKALAEIEKIKFVPDWGKPRFHSFIGNRTEWCISRQRIWGVPIPAIQCGKCDQAFLNAAFVNKVAEKVADAGIEYWDKVTIEGLVADGLLDKNFKCNKCGNADLKKFKQERDILDVWFDSGISHEPVLKNNSLLQYPADLYLEATDQHRGWFQSSLLSAMVMNGSSPTKEILTHGFVLDVQKQKMSKSLGNVITPEQVLQKHGRDIMRLWVASADYEDDMSCSEKWFDNVAEAYRKIRNTCRFLLSNLYDFDIHEDGLDLEHMHPFDQYALATLYDVNNKIHAAYNDYKFAQAFHVLSNYCTTGLSALYLDVVKDRLYLERPDSLMRRSAQSALYAILDTLTRLMAPILSFTSEEIYSHYAKDKKESIHLQNFAEVVDAWGMLGANHVPNLPPQGLMVINTADFAMYGLKMNNAWEVMKELRGIVLKFIEEQRTAGKVKHSLEARVTLCFDKEHPQYKIFAEFLEQLGPDWDTVRFLRDWFIVSQLELVESKAGLVAVDDASWVSVKVEHALGVKCPRCWQWEETSHSGHLCSRCEKVLQPQ